jgi:glycosyltransferase involved in cell wall biosynthesis
VTDWFWERGSLAFDYWVARQLRPGVDAVIGYEHSCLATFRRARTLGIATVYNMTAPHHSVIGPILRDELGKTPGLWDRYRRRTQALDTERNRHKDAEFALSDLVIANSQFTADSILARGFASSRVSVVPLACPPLLSQANQDNGRPAGSMRFLFAGSVSVRKGAHHLLRAWGQLAPSSGELRLAGGWHLPASYRDPLPACTRYLGLLTPDSLSQEYLAADLLVLPSLCDGFGMVVTEALAHGLPVLTTPSTGASDLLRDRENGLIVRGGDVEGLAGTLRWCLQNPERVRSMRERALRTAAARPWTVYRQEFADELSSFLDRSTTSPERQRRGLKEQVAGAPGW